ncbi:MAG: 2-oxoacid:acceptor oxidoreductase subunit alpha [Deltaproteobacteria bacterium]|nr:2-oxoacid:acceptor oxidoreductase subunit alpha [Deltaproteobacteria bacterium]
MQVETLPSLLEPRDYYLSGNEAAAEGALAAGCDFYGGYPITPSSEIMERIAERFGELGRTFVQMEDEIGSICSVIGAAWSGARAMTATSGPGFSLMMEALGYAAFTETPIVIIDVQRAGPCTGQATRVGAGDIMQAKWGSHGDYQVIALSPWSVQEMYEMSAEAFNLAERYRVPAVVLAEEAVGHLRERVRIPPSVEVVRRDRDRTRPPFGTDAPDGVPPMPAFGDGAALMVTGSTHEARGFRRTEDGKVHERLVNRINRKIVDHRGEICRVEGHFLEDARAAVVAYGFTARSSLHAVKGLRAEGLPVGLLRLRTLWPFPVEAVAEVARRVDCLLVPEMNLGQVEGEVRKIARCRVEGYHQVDGEIIHPTHLQAWIKERLAWPET